MSTAECSLPPTAYTLRPNGVQCATKMAASSTAMAISAPSESEAPSHSSRRHCAIAEYASSAMLIESMLIR